ncbi:protein obstructor-E-like [Stegodyphus dumicola]|uniref:protein obstructor-E-like n=1 Tax=Stegodyphus dumicola TaxID=202533 RepID=UPI0015A8CC3B|nr:protein obstructor-E-like [Stegodyphus dumicola]
MIGSIFGLVFTALLWQKGCSEFTCPNSNGYYADPVQCDLYYECRNGEPKAKLCKDGLVFNDLNPLYERCDFPFAVDCKDRTYLQPAQASTNCPRRNGIFAKAGSCKTFWQCKDGLASKMNCQTGLSFNSKSGTCQWQYLVPDCGKEQPESS